MDSPCADAPVAYSNDGALLAIITEGAVHIYDGYTESLKSTIVRVLFVC